MLSSESYEKLYGPIGKSTPVEVSRQAIGGPGGPATAVLNAGFVATKDGFCFDYSSIASENREAFDTDPSGGPSVKGVVLQGPRTRPTDDPYVDEIVGEYTTLPLGGWRTFTMNRAPRTQSGEVPTLNGAFVYNGNHADATQGREGIVYVPLCPDPLPPVAVVTRLNGSETDNGGSTIGRLPFGLLDDEDAPGIVVGGEYVITDVQKSTRASDEEIERWFEEAYRTWGYGRPDFENWRGMQGEDRYSIMVTETGSDQVVEPPPAFYAPPPPPAGTGGLAEQFHSVYGSFRREVNKVLEEGRGSCDYEGGYGISAQTLSDIATSLREKWRVEYEVLRDRDGRPICGELPVAGSLFKNGSSTRSRMWVDVTGAGEEGMAQVPLDVLVDAGKVRERRDGRRGEPVVVEIDRTDSDGEVTVPVDEFDIPEGTETVAFELNRTRNGMRERRVVLVPLTDDMSDEEAERRVRDQYPGWEVTWLDGYLKWGAGEWYSLDLVRRRIHWEGYATWGDLRQQAYKDYLYRTLTGRRGLVVADDLRLMLIQAWSLNPFGWPMARTIPGFQQKIAFLDYYYTGDEVRLPSASRDVPGGGIRTPGAPLAGILEIYLIDRGESTGESMEMVVVNGDGRPIRFSGAVVVEPVELGPEERRRMEAALRKANGRRVTVEAYCLQRELGIPAEGTVMRIAGRSIQQQFQVERRILYAAREARDGGELHPNTSLESYFHSVLQWALWTHEKGYDRREFEEAFVEHARQNFAQAGRAWNGEVERAVRALVPARWDDVQSILKEAES